ncbi:hypothetical protein CCAX7_37520 [Capsulimonas corticalis]|uniref:Uncharacterized protein n=1 Tax=Capsulimonas corticalis TaxID=2219043 RepID=A0A402D112_9BACT|nr:DUF2997 domain-containing protein [Capsulimonas corticalis]BDI31701.1 hypothetical protein CCAX7_37520 [Capsulimonas corticalis]
MAKQEVLEIEIDAAGKVQVHVKGANGKRCTDYVKIFETLLGRVEKQELTAEYYQNEVTGHTHVHHRRD